MHTRLFATVAALVILPAVARAQPLADRVPGDAVMYLGWRGVSTMGTEYAPSHLKGVLEATHLARRVKDTLESLARADQGPDTDQVVKLIEEAGADLWQYPWALYVQAPSPDAPDAQESAPRVVLMCLAGPDAPGVLKRLEAVMPPPPEGPEADAPSLTREGGLVVFRLGRDSAGPPPKPSTSLAAPGGVLAQDLALVKGKPAAVFFLNTKAIIDAFDRNAQDAGAIQRLEAVREATGINGVRGVLWTGAFTPQGWATLLLLDAPGPRTGLVKLLEAPPLSPEALKLVPETAMWFAAFRFDPGAMLDAARTALGNADPDAGAEMDDALGEADKFVGFDLETGLIKALGPEWVFYADGSLADAQGGSNIVAINTPRDAAKVDQSLATLATLANDLVTAHADQGDPPLRFTTRQVEGMTIHELKTTAPTPQLRSLAWTMWDGRLVLGQSASAVVMVAKSRPKEGQTILTNAGYKALRRRLGGGQAIQVHYTDLARTAPVMHAAVTSLLTMAAADAAEGPDAPPNLVSLFLPLPSLAPILPHLAPSGSVGWTDAAGYHSAAFSPFPGSIVFDPPGLFSPTMAFVAGVVVPGLGSARRTAAQARAVSNVHYITIGLSLWANDHQGKTPPDLGTLVEGKLVPPGAMLSPFDGKRLPKDLATWTPAKQKQWVNANTSFVMVPGVKNGVPGAGGDRVSVFEKLHAGSIQRGIVIGYADGSARWLALDAAKALILAQTGKSLEAWSGMAGK